MAIEFKCTECETLLRVDDANRGKMARCPKCSMINPIPSGTKEPLPESVDLRETEERKAPIQYPPAEVERWMMRGVDGGEFGPVRMEELQRWHAEGRINYQCSLQKVGGGEWLPALDVLASGRHATASNTFSSTYSSTAGSSARHFAPHNGTIILVLAIIGALGVFPCAIAAAFMGHVELKKIKRGEVDPSGESTVRAGYVLGVIFSILWILPFSCCCLVPAFRRF